MKLHQLKPKIKRRKKKRLGRGSGSGKGTYAGRGIKGQKSRSGYKIPPPPLITKLPKLRGEGFVRSKKEEIAIVNLRDLEKKYKTGETVSIKSLTDKKLVKPRIKKVKILAKGELKKGLKFAEGLLFSKKAHKMIVKS